MGAMKNQVIERQERKKSNALAALAKRQEKQADRRSSRVFPCESIDTDMLLRLLTSTSVASGCVSFSFNRSGEVRVTAFIEGERVTLGADNLDELDVIMAEVDQAFSEYAANKGWNSDRATSK